MADIFTFPASFGGPHRSLFLNVQFRLFALMGAFYCPKDLYKVISFIIYTILIDPTVPQIERETDQKGIFGFCQLDFLLVSFCFKEFVSLLVSPFLTY